jgi:hypothetical protein
MSVFTNLSFTTEGERLHQSSFTCYERLHHRRSPQKVSVFIIVVHHRR